MNKLEKALRTQDKSKQNKKTELSGTMGVVINGISTVEVPNRKGFVYVLLNTKEQELIQAFNDKVSTVFGLSVIVVWNTNRYEVLRKDDLRYGTWNSSYLPKHGNQHSFNPDGGGGGDVSFIYGKQFVPMSLTPSGTFGAPVAIIAPYSLQENGWHYTPATATPNITNHRPTNNGAKMVLVCLDWNTRSPQLIISTGTFSANLTGSADVIPYLPSTTGAFQIPIAGVRLVSGTTAITWQNIYDVRQYFHPIFTGTAAGGNSMSFAVYEGSATGTAIASGSSTDPLSIAIEVVDNSNLFTLSSNVLTAAQAGWYELTAQVSVVNAAKLGNGSYDVYLSRSSALTYPTYVPYISVQTVADGSSSESYPTFGGTFALNASDTVWFGADNYTSKTIYLYLTNILIKRLGNL